MSLAFHFFKRDFRRSWWLFAAWSLLIVIDDYRAVLAQPPTAPSFGAPVYVSFIQPVVLILPLICLSLVLLVVRVVHEDRLVGTTAFWLSRPVRRSSLLLAKLASLVLIILIPVVIHSLSMIYLGYSTRELGLALAQIILTLLFYVIPIAVLAALTPNFGRFAAAAAALAVGLGIPMVMMQQRLGSSVVTGTFTTLELARTRDLGGSALLIAGLGLVLVHQYLTRKSARSVVLGLCAIAAYLGVTWFWPWSLVRDRPNFTLAGAPGPVSVLVHITTASLDGVPYNALAPNHGKNIDGPYAVSGVPGQFFARLRSADPRMTGPGGLPIKTLGAIPTVPPYLYDPPAISAISAALGGIPVSTGRRGEPSATFVSIDGDTFSRDKQLPVRLVDDLDLVLSRYEIMGEMPVFKGSRCQRGSDKWEILDVQHRADGVTIVVAECSANLLFSANWHPPGHPTDPRVKGDSIFVLVNRSRSEAVLTNQSNSSESTEPLLDGIIVRHTIELPFGGNYYYGPSPTIDTKWLEGATLVRLERIPVSEFKKTVTVEIPILGEPWSAIGMGSHPDSNLRREIQFLEATSDAATNETSLPMAAYGRAAVVISIGKGVAVAVNGKVATDQQLATVLEGEYRKNRHALVLVACDDTSDYKRAAFVLGLCRRVGFTNVVLQSR